MGSSILPITGKESTGEAGYGEHDALTPPADAQALANALPEAELHVIPGAGHMSNLENPAAFNERLLGFLEESGSWQGKER